MSVRQELLGRKGAIFIHNNNNNNNGKKNNRLEINGPKIHPRDVSVLKERSFQDNNELNEIRLFHLDFSKLPNELVQELEKIILQKEQQEQQQQEHKQQEQDEQNQSRLCCYWDSCVVCYCKGSFTSPLISRGLLQTRRLELYGSMEWIRNLESSSSSSSLSSSSFSQLLGSVSSPVRVLRIRDRFNQTNIRPLIQGLKNSSTPNNNNNKNIVDSSLTTTTTTESPIGNGGNGGGANWKRLELTCVLEDEKSEQLLCHALQHNVSLESLSWYGCEFASQSQAEQLLVAALEHHPTLSTLQIRDNSHLPIKGLASLLLTNALPNLKTLSIYHPPHSVFGGDDDNLGGRGGRRGRRRRTVQVPRLNIELLSIALKENTTLKSLQLSGNGLTSACVLWLSLALTYNTTLETLDLQDNQITDVGVCDLANNLTKFSGLKRLYLWDNSFTAVGAQALVNALKDNIINNNNNNTTLEEITTFSKFHCSPQLLYYTCLNKAGRRLIWSSGNNDDNDDDKRIPLSLWPMILERVHGFSSSSDPTRQVAASVLYTLLRERPDVLLASAIVV